MPIAILPLPKKLGFATFIANYPSGSPQWHELRAEGIGGSEVGTICGLNRWESAFTLWAKKSGKIADLVKQSEPMEWGSRLEPVIFDKFVSVHPELMVWDDAGTWAHETDTYAHANPDGIYQREDGSYGILEIKTASYPDDWKLPAEGVMGSADGVPRYYLTQVQHYLRVFGFQEAIVAALFTGNKYREFYVPADPFQQEVDKYLVDEFRACIANDTKPDWDGSANTYETVRAMNPDIVEDDVELGALGLRLLSANSASKLADEELTKVKSEVLDVLGIAKNGLLDGEVIVSRQAGRNGAAPFLVIKKGTK
jgi:putative phage-type endonuclease